MTRSERRGTIVVLVLIALMLAGTVAVRSCRTVEPAVLEQQAVEMEHFDAETDSVPMPAVKRQQHSSRDSSRRSLRPRRTRKNKPPKLARPAPRPMDPVPQF